MLRNLIFFLSLLILIVTFISCSENKYETPESVIYANVKYMAEENFSATMETIHPESPEYSNTERLVQEIFDRFDLSYNIEQLEVLESNNDKARVKFIQLTTKVAGAEFANNRMTGVHTIIKDGDSWKIYSTQSENIEYLP